MSAEDDIDRFIQEQKKKIARERQDLQHANPNQTSDPGTNGFYRNGDASLKENRPPQAAPAQKGRGQPQTDETGLPLGSHLTIREKLQKERHDEYNRFLDEKKNRSSMKRSTVEGDGLSLPIGERNSAKDRARNQRNREYNEFLKQQGGQKRRSRESSLERPPGGAPVQTQAFNGGPQSNGYGPTQQVNGSYDAPRVQREASSQTPVPRGYDDPPPRGPRKGWGTPQPLDYEDVLRRRREEETRYRRNDDFDYYQPRLKPAYSDPYLNRYEEDGRRSSRRDNYDDYDRRRVRFSDEVPPPGPPGPPRGGEYSDRSYRPRPRDGLDEPVQYDWSQSKTGRSRTFTDIDRPKPALKQEEADRPPRAKSATYAEDVGLPIGPRETNSATRRKKEQYRKELEQQMKETKAAKIREKQLDRSPGFPGANQPAAPQNMSGRQSRNQPQAVTPGGQGQGGVQQAPPQRYTPSFANQPYGTRAQQPQQAAPSFPGQYGQAQTPSFGQGSQLPPAQPLGDLGLKEALAKSQPDLVDRPFSLNYPSPATLNPPGVNSTDPYMYYGMRNPLDADPNPSMVPGLPHPTAATATTVVPPSSTYQSPLMERYLLLQQQQHQLLQQQQQIAQQTARLEQQLPTAPAQLNQALNQPNVSKQAAAHLRGESSIKNFVGDSQLSPRSQMTGASYREQLMLQMKEKEAKKVAANAEKAAYDAKFEKDVEVYDPWGKGGGGAPMRDKQGKIVADLKKLHDRNETLLNDPRRQDLQLYAGTNAPLANPALAPGQEVSPLLAAAAAASAGPGTGAGPGVGVGVAPTYGRVKGTITGAAPDPVADSNRNEYQEMLRLQVEEKKRREAEEKEKIRQEEEREERRLEAQRERIQKEYEAEVERKKQKEEAQRKQKEDLERQLEEKRQEADKKKKETNDRKRKEADDKMRDRDLNHNVATLNQRVASPPIPTLRTKEPERTASPPIPTLRKGDQGEKRTKPEEPSRRSTSSPPIPTHQSKDKKGRISESQDDDFPGVSAGSSPPVPAVTTKERGGPKDEQHVMGALSAMRMQLAHEQQRIQSQLDKHRDYDPYNPMPKAAHAPRRGSPQVDVFELARHKGSVAVLRNTAHQAAEDFDGLKNRRRKATTNDIPSMRDIGRGSPAIPLDSDSAFIGIDSGETHMPKTPYRPTRSNAVPSPVDSQPRKSGRSVSALDNDDLDMIIAKSKARSDAIGTLHEHDSDPDDILNKFLSKKSYDSRPPSGKSDDLSLWLKPSP